MKTARNVTVILVACLILVATHTALAFYNPSVGRWLSRDPIGEAGGANVYLFAENRSINSYDLLGLIPPAPGPYPPQPRIPGPGPLPEDAQGFEMCRRDALGDDCQTKIANAFCGGAHSFLRRKFINEQGETDYTGWGWGGQSPPSEEGPSIVKPKQKWMVSCAACRKTDGQLARGKAASVGKSGKTATDGEIWECIQQVPPSKPYAGLGYNCWEWAKEAASKCGLTCPTPPTLSKPPGY